MRVAVSSSGQDLDAAIDPRFGRCAYFLIVDTESLEYEVFNNESGMLGGGAGIQSAQFVASKGAQAVLTGNCGPNAVQTLTAANIEVIIGQSGTVREAIEKFKSGETVATEEPNVQVHYGMGDAGSGATPPLPGGGRGMGGGGRGMGGGGRGMGGGGRGMGGGGRGMGGGGRGMGGGGRGMGGGGRAMASDTVMPFGATDRRTELQRLKEQAGDLENQMADVLQRIRSLEKEDS